MLSSKILEDGSMTWILLTGKAFEHQDVLFLKICARVCTCSTMSSGIDTASTAAPATARPPPPPLVEALLFATNAPTTNLKVFQ